MVKYQPFYYKLVDHEIKKNTSFNLICLHLQKKIILEIFIAAPTEYFTVKSEQEMDLASVSAMNFMCLKLLYFSSLSRGPDPLNPSLVTPASIVPIRATNKVRNLNVLRVMLRLTNMGSLSSKFEIL